MSRWSHLQAKSILVGYRTYSACSWKSQKVPCSTTSTPWAFEEVQPKAVVTPLDKETHSPEVHLTILKLKCVLSSFLNILPSLVSWQAFPRKILYWLTFDTNHINICLDKREYCSMSGNSQLNHGNFGFPLHHCPAHEVVMLIINSFNYYFL